VLLDTHTLVWFAMDLPRLPSGTRDMLQQPDTVVLVSPVSAFEIATKHRLGKWPEVAPLLADYDGMTDVQGFERLPLTDAHGVLAGRLTAEHRDPFDRLLAAQALSEQVGVVSNDTALDAFGVVRLW
jgi:PIN domain nuclease of toxin-antitoxin system